ncbi:uncharacterized protein LOC104899751 [Beta vulgaris subsp. vulgaris]|uniref:uncharacterized protein LOC104899751 n=1 Tax=Beta vulgaris subsp. vulgaris TaxID=3555 RepID=UPI002036B24A|nr:uncharacterized protein LOC104899751 [Beta vulgaris subsp. vulgaris]
MIIRKIITNVPKLKHTPIFVPIAQNLLSSYYYYCFGLLPCIIDLDDQTTMHFWISNHRRHDRPNLVLIHGCGGDACWQFFLQIGSLSKSFNIYMPDLLFFGKSYTKCMDRTPRYQAKCVMEGLKKGFGVDRCTVYSISYGGWVGYSMAEMYPNIVEMNVIVSTGVGTTIEQKLNQLSRVGKQAEDLVQVVIPKDTDAIKLLVKSSSYKSNPAIWAPDFLLWEFIRVMEDKNRKEKEELIRCLISGEADSNVSALSQETLLVWGDQDIFFPEDIGHQLLRMLGPKARLMIIKETGHAVNIDSPKELNELIKSFIFGKLDK